MSDPVQIGRYRILGRLGRGAMGVVYRGIDAALEREVALKVMAAGRGADAQSRERFSREAKAAARLQHPNIVTIYELGEHDGAPFMALELLEGVDLQRAIEGGLRPNPKVTLPIVLQLVAGLGHAHEHGIVHRDVKPSNLFLPRGRQAKIMDFGVARLGGGATSTGVVGTPNYMSPEQVQGAVVDGRSDLFSAGLILYELVTGEKAYRADTVVALLYQIAHESPNLSLIPPGPQWQRLRDVLARALAKLPDDRYPDAMAMGNDLKQALIDLGGSPDAGAASDLGLMVRTPQRPTAQLAHLAEALPPVVETVALAAAAAPSDTDSGAAPAKPPTPLAPKRPVAALAMTFAAALIFGVVGAALALRSFTTPPTATPAAPTTVATRPPASPGASTPPPVTRAPAPATTRPPATSIAARPATPPPATPVTTTLAAADSVSAEARLDRANDFMEKQNFLAALAEARSVLSRQPGNAAAKAMVEDAEAALVVETRIKNAREAIKRGNHEEALAEVRAGLSVNASDSRLIALFRELTK